MSTPFGAGVRRRCRRRRRQLRRHGRDPVATAASNNPALSTLVTAVTEAKLVDTLNGADDITVFAPTDDAFAAMDEETLDAALADPKGLLTTVLTYHVVPGGSRPRTLAGTHETLQGGTLEVTGSGEDFTVNGERQRRVRQRADGERHRLPDRRRAASRRWADPPARSGHEGREHPLAPGLRPVRARLAGGRR